MNHLTSCHSRLNITKQTPILEEACEERGLDITSFTSRLHHHTAAYCVKGIRYEPSDSGDGVSDHPADHNMGVLRVGQHACKTQILQTNTKADAIAQCRISSLLKQLLINLTFSRCYEIASLLTGKKVDFKTVPPKCRSVEQQQL